MVIVVVVMVVVIVYSSSSYCTCLVVEVCGGGNSNSSISDGVVTRVDSPVLQTRIFNKTHCRKKNVLPTLLGFKINVFNNKLP